MTLTIEEIEKFIHQSSKNQYVKRGEVTKQFMAKEFSKEINKGDFRSYLLKINEFAREKALNLFEETRKAEAITFACKKGCNHCCYFPIDIFPFEALYIENYVNINFSEEKKLEIRTKLKEAKYRVKKEVGPVKFTKEYQKKYTSKLIACPFLDGVNGCSIYEARPQSCLSYFEFNTPTSCQKNLFSESAVAFGDVEMTVGYIIKNGIMAYCEQHGLSSEVYFDRYLGNSNKTLLTSLNI